MIIAHSRQRTHSDNKPKSCVCVEPVLRKAVARDRSSGPCARIEGMSAYRAKTGVLLL